MSVRTKKLIAIVAGSVIFVFLMAMIGLFAMMAFRGSAEFASIGILSMIALGAVLGFLESRREKARKAAKKAQRDATT